MNPITPDWAHALPIQQQSVMILAARGPDGIAKHHPCKPLVRVYRATVIKAAAFGRMMTPNDKGDTFMDLHPFQSRIGWEEMLREFFDHVDALPHHYYLHLAHGAQIVGFKHPERLFRDRWSSFYRQVCVDLHVTPETESEMDDRLNDEF